MFALSVLTCAGVGYNSAHPALNYIPTRDLRHIRFQAPQH